MHRMSVYRSVKSCKKKSSLSLSYHTGVVYNFTGGKNITGQAIDVIQ